jgi:hypothetical protein
MGEPTVNQNLAISAFALLATAALANGPAYFTAARGLLMDRGDNGASE